MITRTLRPRRAWAPLVLVSALVTLDPGRAGAQAPEPPPPVFATKIEAFLAMPDVVLVQDSYRVDTPPSFGMILDALVVTEVDPESRRVQGLRIALRDAAKPGAQTSNFLDIDEAVSLSRALASMLDLSARWTGAGAERSTDTHFVSADGFVVGIHQSGRIQNAFIASGPPETRRIAIDVRDFATLKTAIDQAIAVLTAK